MHMTARKHARTCTCTRPRAAQGDGKGFKAKISDFGLSQHMAKGQQEVLVSKGTEAYLSPEVVETFTISEASDVYAMGLLMWELWHGIFWHAMWAKEKKKRGCDFFVFVSIGMPPPCPILAPLRATQSVRARVHTTHCVCTRARVNEGGSFRFTHLRAGCRSCD